jgi:hypothetical protein
MTHPTQIPAAYYRAAANDPCLERVLEMVRWVEDQKPADLVELASRSPRPNDTFAKWMWRHREAVILVAAEAAAARAGLEAALAEIRTLRRQLTERGDFTELKASRERFGLSGGLG